MDRLTHTDVALEWHQQREKQIEKLGVKDTWEGYSTALKERFRDPARAHRDAQAMHFLKYKGDISEYLSKMQELNYSVGWSGVSFREQITKTVPRKVVEMLYSRQGGIPEDDEEFLEQISIAGLIYETMQVDPGLQRQGKEESDSRKKERSKSDQQKRSPTERSKRKRYEGNKRDDSPREKKWSTVSQALAGCDQSDINKFRSEKRSCIRCGRNNHAVLECYASRSDAGKELPKPPERTVAAVKKEGIVKQEVENLPKKKKVKIAGVMREISPLPQIYEMESDSADSSF